MQGPPNTLVLRAAGLDDFGFGSLPVVLPGPSACLLEVSPDLVLVHVTSAAGTASQPVAIPPSAAFVGTVVFAQWAHFDLAGFSVSSAVAHWVGF